MTQQGFIDFMVGKGKIRDRWGHFAWTRPDGTKVRYKVGKLAARHEVWVEPVGWVRLRSGYYRQLSITDEGKLKGMTR